MRILLLVLACLIAPASLWGSAASPWDSFGFDGTAFVRGAAEGLVVVREGYLPQSAANPLHEDRLPHGTGAVALLCYQERSGGKLKAQPRFSPMGGIAVTLAGASFTVGGRSDAGGILILALPPGNYQVRWLGFSKTVAVEKGKTSLVALRGGKRMVD